jgi:hypothetical protein
MASRASFGAKSKEQGARSKEQGAKSKDRIRVGYKFTVLDVA